mgnify:FL=1
MYRKLEIWRDSIDLLKEVYILADKLPKSEEYNLKSQLKRAMVSVPLNIAEGKCRASSKDFSHFLNIAAASMDEVDVVLTICEELGFLQNLADIHEKNKVLTKRINALRRKLSEENDE